MDDGSPYFELINGHRRGPTASLARGGLRILAWLYGRAVGVRNFYYSSWALPGWLDAPVISVGNLTVGGTGKTPMTLWLCRKLLERHRKPAVLSRGYNAVRGQPGDEILLVARRCPEAVAIANPDRLTAGQIAIEQYGAQAIILDDGFQHRRVLRDLDIVLIDASCPFGFDHILPRGLLRESPASLLRSEAVVVTRCDQVAPEEVGRIDERIHRYNPLVPIVHAVHRPTGFADLAGIATVRPTGSRFGCFAGIARPGAFLATLASVGITPADRQWWPDHYNYSEADVDALCKRARDGRLDALITTEKDAVKLASLGVEWSVPVVALTIEIEMLDGGDRILTDLIDETIREYEAEHGPESPAD